MSRFNVLPVPVAYPGKCISCGAVNSPVVDFGANIEFYGAVYFCVDCLTEISRTIDMRPARDFDILEGKFEQQLETYQETNNVRIVSNEWYSLVADLVGGLSTAFSAASLSGDDETSEPSGTEVPTEPVEIEPASKKPARTAKQSTKPAGDEGPASVSASTGDGDKPFSF